MKKFFVFLFLGLCLFSCNKEKTFNDVINEDYDNAVALAGDDELFFYEVETHVSEFFDECKKVPTMDSIKVIYQIPRHECVDTLNAVVPYVYFLDRTYVNDVPDTNVVVNDFWMGDFKFNPNNCLISYEKAVEILHKHNNLPHTQFMTLRWPTNLSMLTDHPLYIFGHSVAVDAMTGDIIDFTNVTEALPIPTGDSTVADTVAIINTDTIAE